MIDLKFNPKTIEMMGSNSVGPIVEFSALFVVVIVTYLLINRTMSHLSFVIKFLVAMFLGTVGYAIGKLAVLTFIALIS